MPKRVLSRLQLLAEQGSHLRPSLRSVLTPAGTQQSQGERGCAVGDALQQPDLSPLQCAASLDFWLLFLIFGMGAGCGLLFINNVGAWPRHAHTAQTLACDQAR